MTPEQIKAAQRIGLTVLEAIRDAGPTGAPSGVLYAALMGQGCTFSQYQSLMAPLERRGYVQLEHQCYTLTSTGQAFINQLKQTVDRGHLITPTAQPA
ncbi:hypothetical protein LJR189_004781 [Acidovorax delafieldii]|uniref:hypothetical protein n=1 Tax=Acidovorax delafieldii TaxID=47920 RepID=UPI003ECC210F